RWLPEWNGRRFFLPSEPNMPSTRNAIQNTLSRAPFHKRWWINDPDCLLVRPDSDLTLAEVQSMATAIALTGGSMLLSDDVPNLPPERVRIVQQLLPLIGQSGRVIDWFDASAPRLVRLDLENATGQWHLLAIFNWDDKPTGEQFLPVDRFDLPEGDYFAREFWSGNVNRVDRGLLTLRGIPAHGVSLFALTPCPSPSGSSSTLTPNPSPSGSSSHLASDSLITNSSPSGSSSTLTPNPSPSGSSSHLASDSLTPNPSPGGRGGLYLGSDLHISQGLEVIRWTATHNEVDFILERRGDVRGQVDLHLVSPPSEILIQQKSVSWDKIGSNIYRIEVNCNNRAHVQIKTRSRP
ncbi:MAG: hypothetical protein U9Q82_11445, partial [Chloroflexota bacterium]|nr:hypothetical protein [Chloroflexota bacterium]